MNMWDERYGVDEYVYGTEPNDFLVECLKGTRIGRTFSAAEGEGRNAVWMVRQGAQVESIDSSEKGVEKTHLLAAKHGVTVSAAVGPLENVDLAGESFDTIVSVFAHMPSEQRAELHRKFVRALKPGGRLVLEAYTPNQLQFATGGPKDPDMLLTEEILRAELDGPQFKVLREVERDVVEGSLHTGRAAVVQCLALKPFA